MDDAAEFSRKQTKAASRVRGLMLGMALGDTLGAVRGKLPETGPLRAGVSTQLACFTVDGIIRASVRARHRGGVCHPPSVVWHAYCRWAALQGIEVEKMRRRWAPGDEGIAWPDGWLAQIPALAEPRGSAPATVAALSKVEQGSIEKPTTNSRGCHALTRTLPVAVAGTEYGRDIWIQQAREIAALTHGDRAAQSAAACGTALVHHCLTSAQAGAGDAWLHGEPVRDTTRVRNALQEGLDALPTDDDGGTDDERSQLGLAFQHAVDHPGDPRRLAELAPDATAPSALLGGLYVAASFPDRAEISSALHFAAGAPDGASVGCVTGALLGAAHGAEALPVDLVSRHELAWVLDTLARDLVSEITDSPSGSEYIDGWDPSWWHHYPGG